MLCGSTLLLDLTICYYAITIAITITITITIIITITITITITTSTSTSTSNVTTILLCCTILYYTIL